MAKIEVKHAALVAGATAALTGALMLAYATQPQPTEGPRFEMAVHNYLVSNPEVLMEMQNALMARRDVEAQGARDDALAAIGQEALLDPKIAYVTGPQDAAVTVVEFFDYRCGFCKASLPALKAALETYPDVRFAFVEYPILTEDSLVAATAAVAARRQPGTYVPFHLALMEATGELPLERILSIAESVGIDIAKLQTDMNDPEVTASLDASHELANQLHVNGTPTFIINGAFKVGELSGTQLADLIEGAAG